MDHQSDNAVKEDKKNDEATEDAHQNVSHRALRRIKDQMEFYFSDANLQRDRLLGRLVNEDPNGFVHLRVFTTFNKIRVHTTEVGDIKKALRYSHILELSEDGLRVHRKIPFVPFSDEKLEERTIYVERIPQDADDVFVRNLFKKFGKVTYIGLPRFKKTRKLKGYAFVEFELVESVQKACEFYKAQNQELEAESEATDQEGKKVEGKRKRSLDSHKSFKKQKRSENEKSQEKGSRKAGDADRRPGGQKGTRTHRHEKFLSRKRKRLSSESERSAKKSKVSSSADGSREPIPKIEVDSSSADESSSKLPKLEREIKSEDSEGLSTSKTVHASEEGGETAESCTSVSSKEIKSEVSESNEEPETNAGAESDGVEQQTKRRRKKQKKSGSKKLKLRVITKSEWKIYRNKYLALQRKSISRLKKMLFLNRRQTSDCDAMLSRSTEETAAGDDNNLSSKKGSVNDFQPNSVLKIMLDKAPASVQDFINGVRTCGDVAYVDASDPEVAYVRFRNPDSAVKCLQERKLNHLGACALVTGKAEQEYWEKINKVKEELRNRPRQKKRGRDKILARAEKMLEKEKTHLHFKL